MINRPANDRISSTRPAGSLSRKQRNTVRRIWRGLEQLEPRQLLSGVTDLDNGLNQPTADPTADVATVVEQTVTQTRNVSANWFTDLAPEVTNNGNLGIDSFNTVEWNDTSVQSYANEWIVQLNNAGLQQAGGVTGVADVLSLDLFGGQVIRGLGLEGMVLVQTGHDVDTSLFEQTLTSSGWVEYVQPNIVLQSQATPNDTYFSSLYGQHNTGQTGGTADADIDAPEAWELTTGASSIVVGVIDTGVDWSHPDLVDNMWVNPGEIAGNGIDDDGNGFIDDIYGYDFANNDGNPMDDNGHGTHAAGTIGATGNNNKGVVGVVWDVSIMALKFLTAGGSGSTANAVRAVNYATMMNTDFNVDIRLTNNSWGGGGYSTALFNAIAANRDAGMLFLAAAGNDSTNNDNVPQYPANYNLDNIISVAATDHRDKLASFSNYGASSVDLGAPGVSIRSTMPGNSYGYMSGTSMATPQVAGVAALAWSYDNSATWQEVKSAILTGGDSISALNGKTSTGKRLNALGTLQQLSNDPAPDPDPDPTPDPDPDPTGPEVTVKVGSTNITDGQNQKISFGTATQNQTGPTKTFTVTNDGDQTLNLSNLSVAGNFTVVEGLSSSLTAGSSDTFTVRMTTSSVASNNGTISFTTNDSDEATFNFGITGSVIAPDGTVDLSVAFTRELEAVIVPGKAQNATVVVTNNGNATFNDTVTIKLWASSTSTLANDAIELYSTNALLVLKDGKSKPVRMKVDLDQSVTVGDYYIIAEVDPDDDVDESNENNNTATASAQTELAWKFGNLGNNKKTSLKITDDSGTLLTFSLNGDGIGNVSFDDSNNTYDILVTGTNKNSTIAVKTKGGLNAVRLGDITIGDPDDNTDTTSIKQFAASRGDLIGGDFRVAGTIEKIRMRNVSGGSTLQIGGVLRDGVQVRFSRISDFVVTSSSGFKTFTAIDWRDLDGTTDKITAPWIGKLSIKGDKKQSLIGNFAADLNLTGVGAGRYVADTVRIGGAVNNRTWDFTGNVKTFRVDSFSGTDVDVNGYVDILNAGHWVGGSLNAHAIAKIRTSGAKNVSSTGAFDVDLTLSGSRFKRYTLDVMSVTGGVNTRTWDIEGKVNKVAVKGDVDGLTMNVTDDSENRNDASVNRMVFKTISDADITVEGNVGFIRADTWTTGTLTAESVTKSRVNGASLNNVTANKLNKLSSKLNKIASDWMKGDATLTLVF